ncbi:MAG: alpha/beta hydrolase-fold protein [Mobilicoccus sp.]|nr:alpha/beta hydrolase-fold protein [Mobilicoccus sp.]
MSLTDPVVVWGLRGVFLAAVLWVVIRWPRAAGPGVVAILRRLVAIVVLVVLGVLNVAAPINAQYGWYTDWADLASLVGPIEVLPPQPVRGATPVTAVVEKTAAFPPAAQSTAPRASTTLTLTPTTTGGGYQEVTVPGPVSGMSGTVLIWVPPSYTRPENARREYPVIETFHGFDPAPMAYFNVFDMDQAMADEVAAHRVSEAIIVIPYWAPGGVDTECVDGSGGRVETWLTQDVPAWVYTHLRAKSGRDSWATLGTSAGGYCSLMTTMLHPQTFATAISFGGYARPDFSTSYAPFAPDSEQARRYDLTRVAASAPPVALWALWSLPDTHLVAPQMDELMSAVRAPTSLTPTILPAGGHRSEVWTPYFPSALAWLGATSKGFAPNPTA